MKKLAILVVTAVVVFSSCIWDVLGEAGNGVSVDTAIEVPEFNSISVPSSVDVYYVQTPMKQSLTLTCDENLVEFFLINVEDGALVISTKPGVSIRPKVDTYLTVYSPTLEAVKLSGSGDVHIGSPIVSEGDFAIRISGSGDVETSGTVSCRNFSARTSGSGDAFVAGVTAASAEFKSSGSGDLESDSVTAEEVSVALSGSGDCELVCRNAGIVQVRISGSGDCTLSGSAATLANLSLSGSGDLDVSRLVVGR